MRIGFESRQGETGILLLHGLTGTPDEVEPLGKYLAQKGISTLAPWLKGHGTTPKDLSKTTWQDWAESVYEAYEEILKRCSQVFVGGLSMGGAQSLHLAAHYPVAGVISMATPVRIFDFRFNAIAFFRFLQWRTSNLTGGILDSKSPAHITYPYVATKNLYELKKLMDQVRPELPQIKVPALVVQGRKDSMVPSPNGQIIYDALGSAKKHLLYLENSDHVVTMDYDKNILFEKAFRFIQSNGESIEV
jgi:carboxylesterase